MHQQCVSAMHGPHLDARKAHITGNEAQGTSAPGDPWYALSARGLQPVAGWQALIRPPSWDLHHSVVLNNFFTATTQMYSQQLPALGQASAGWAN